MQDWIQELLGATGLGEPIITVLSYLSLIAAVALLSWGVATLTRRLILRIVSRLIRSTETRWDDQLLESGFFRYLGRIGPGLVIFLAAPAFGPGQDWLERLSMAYIIVIAVQVVSAALDATLAIYQSYEDSNQRPIRGYMTGTLRVGRVQRRACIRVASRVEVVARQPFHATQQRQA